MTRDGTPSLARRFFGGLFGRRRTAKDKGNLPEKNKTVVSQPATKKADEQPQPTPKVTSLPSQTLPPTHLCENCSESFPTNEELATHVRSAHNLDEGVEALADPANSNKATKAKSKKVLYIADTPTSSDSDGVIPGNIEEELLYAFDHQLWGTPLDNLRVNRGRQLTNFSHFDEVKVGGPKLEQNIEIVVTAPPEEEEGKDEPKGEEIAMAVTKKDKGKGRAVIAPDDTAAHKA